MVDVTDAQQVCTAASSLLFPELDFDIAANATYSREDFLKVLSRIACENEFANAGAKQFQLARGEDVAIETSARNPLARALLYHLRNIDADGIDRQFDTVREKIFSHAARTHEFNSPVDVAIDIHDWLFYGDEETPKVSSTNPAQGTDLAYKFATICVVEPPARFTLAWTHLESGKTDEVADAIRHLVSEARTYVDINRLFLDREFYRVQLVETVKDLDVELVLRAPKTDGIKRRLEAHDEERFVTEYEMVSTHAPTGRTGVRLVVAPHRSRNDESFCLVTTREFESDAVEFAGPLAESYRRRWGVETSYRKVTEFLPRTASPTFSVRLFYFSFAVAWYNLWILVNLLVTPRNEIRRGSVVPTAVFRELLHPISYG